MKKEEFIKRYGEEKYQEKLEKGRLDSKRRRSENKEKCDEATKKWRNKNREHYLIQQRKHKSDKYKTIEYRLSCLIRSYKRKDKKYNRGECTLTVEELIQLLNEGCYWCGEKDWHKLGADRIDNSKPHTLENCVCCCSDCNNERQRKGFDDFKIIKKVS